MAPTSYELGSPRSSSQLWAMLSALVPWRERQRTRSAQGRDKFWTQENPILCIPKDQSDLPLRPGHHPPITGHLYRWPAPSTVTTRWPRSHLSRRSKYRVDGQRKLGPSQGSGDQAFIKVSRDRAEGTAGKSRPKRIQLNYIVVPRNTHTRTHTPWGIMGHHGRPVYPCACPGTPL